MARGGKVPSARQAPTELTTTDGFGRGRVSEIQRVRLLAAMAEVAHERGAKDVAVAHVVERAGVSRRTFYEIFVDREDCLLAAFAEAVRRAGQYVSYAHDPLSGWAESMRGGLEAMLRFLDEEPAMGRLAVVESLGAGPRVLESRRGILSRIVDAVDRGREIAGVDSPATMLTAEGVVGGVLAIVHDRMVAGGSGRFVELVNPLMSMIALPYLGPAAASQELIRHTRKSSAHGPAGSGNPLKGLEMRLTYRTVRVLSAVAVNHGASNRAIGEASGVADQGQISKLLARLEKLGLVENHRNIPSKSAPNAWTLTRQGVEVANVIATRATPS